MISQYLRDKSVSPSVVPSTFRRGGTKAFHFRFVLMRFDDLKKQAVIQSTLTPIMSTNAERTGKEWKKKETKNKKKSPL